MRIRLALAATLTAFLAVAAPAHAQYADPMVICEMFCVPIDGSAHQLPTVPVVNAGFGRPDIPRHVSDNFGWIEGWTATNACGIEVQDHIAGDPYEGNQFVELNSNCRSGVRQAVTLFNYPVMYRVSFAFSPRPYFAPEDNKMHVYWNGEKKMTVGSLAGGSTTQWRRHSVDVMAKTEPGAGVNLKLSNVLSFVSAGTNPSGGRFRVYLDDVRIEVLG